jgi:hypothetical protein
MGSLWNCKHVSFGACGTSDISFVAIGEKKKGTLLVVQRTYLEASSLIFMGSPWQCTHFTFGACGRTGISLVQSDKNKGILLILHSKLWSKMYICPHVVYRLLSSCTIVFPHYLIIGKFYEKIARNLKCVPWFSLQIFSEKFFIILRNKRDMIKNVYLSSHSVPVIVKLYNSFSTLSHNRQVLQKYCTESKMCASIFSTTFGWNIFYYNKKWARYDQKCICPRVVYRLLSSCTIVFPHYLIIGKFYEKIAGNLKCVPWFLLKLLSETFFIIIRNERDMIKNPLVFTCYCQVVQ